MTVSNISLIDRINQEIKTIICSKCGECLPATFEFFYIDKISASGFRGACKKCMSKAALDYRSKNRKKISEYSKSRYRENRPEIIKKAAKYREKNRKKINAQSSKSRIKHKEEIKIKDKIRRVKNKEYNEAYRVEYYKNNKEKIRKRGATYYTLNKEKIKEHHKIYSKKNKEKISKRMSKYNKSGALYETYYERLSVFESVRKSKTHDGLLETKCAYCGKWFQPKKGAVAFRLSASKTMLQGEGRLYCSQGCKDACPIYKRIKYPRSFKNATSREANPHLRQIVLKRDNYTCQICGDKDAQLHCHHITPATQNPGFAEDPFSCITLCKKCHKNVHKHPGCKYHELTCGSKQKEATV